MSNSSRERFAAVVRSDRVDVALACLLIGCEVEPDLDLARPLAHLDALAEEVRPLLDRGAAQALRTVLGDHAGFGGTAADFGDVRSSLLHEVLRRRRGLPILLSVVWVEVAQRLDLPAVCLGLPGRVLADVGLGDVVDPFDGGRRVPEAPFEPVLDAVSLLSRVLTNIRVLTSGQGRSMEATRAQLWATELSLLLPRHPLALRRERGELLVRLGDHLGGAAQLEHYAELVEDVDAGGSAAALRGARQARARLN